MPSNPVKPLFFIFLSTLSINLYADYNITINVHGKEYYSESKGSTDKEVVSVGNDGSISVNYKKTHKTPDQSDSGKIHHRAYRKGHSKYDHLVDEAASRHRIDPKLVHAVIQAESSYNEKAVSPAGAAGLMQLMPGTARQYGVSDRFDPYQNIEGGARYLKHLMELFDSNLNLTLAAYNAGENAVIRHDYTIPPYAETQHYVKKVLSLQKGRKPGNGKRNWFSPNPFVSWSDSDYSWDGDNP